MIKLAKAAAVHIAVGVAVAGIALLRTHDPMVAALFGVGMAVLSWAACKHWSSARHYKRGGGNDSR